MVLFEEAGVTEAINAGALVARPWRSRQAYPGRYHRTVLLATDDVHHGFSAGIY